MKRHAAVSLLLLLISIPSALGQERTQERAPLRRLKKFGVVIENVGAEAVSAGLSEAQLRTDVELRLRRSRVPVQDSTQMAYLYVRVNPMHLSSGVGWAFSVHVGVYEIVLLVRDKSIACNAETWETGKVGFAPNPEFVSSVRESVGDMVDMFINDYLAANP